jgi:hypothetical protein
LDFSAILAATHGEKPSVVQIRATDISPEAIGGQVVAALRHTAAELVAGALITIGPSRTRLRLLPLRRDWYGSSPWRAAPSDEDRAQRAAQAPNHRHETMPPTIPTAKTAICARRFV